MSHFNKKYIENNNYFVYYKDEKTLEFRCYNVKTKEFFSTFHLSGYEYQHRFELMKGYEMSDKSILQYVQDFEGWCKELYSNSIFSIEYQKYLTHGNAVYNVFKMFAKGLYEHFENIDYTEMTWIEKCHNGGLTYCKTGKSMCYGYDWTGFYPSIMSTITEFKIPTKRGEEYFINKLPKTKKLMHGFYHVKITCDNPDFKKIFAFSPENVYMHYSIAYAKKHKKQFNVKFELVQNEDEPNCYLYKEEDLIPAHKVFSGGKGKYNWFNVLSRLKKQFPKNKLIKHLSTSLHGTLIQFYSATKTPEQIKSENLIVNVFLNDDTQYVIRKHVIKQNGSEYFKLINVAQPYSFNIRLKSWLTAFGRNEAGDTALLDLDHVVRINTDGVVFDREQNIKDIINLLPEEKSSGLIEWFNVNSNDKMIERRLANILE